MNKQSFIIEANSIQNLPISGDFSFNNSNKNLIIFCHGFKGFKDWGCWNLVSNYFCQRGFNFLKFNFSHNGTTVSNPSEITDFNAFRNNNYSIELQDIGRVINYVKSMILVTNDLPKASLIVSDLQKKDPECVIQVYFWNETEVEHYWYLIDSTEVELDQKFIDFNFHTHLRHQGNKEHAKNYLKWETDLIKNMDEEEREFFR